MFLKYSEIPGQQKLFLDYLYKFENVKHFYGKNFRDADNFNGHFQSILKIEKDHLQLLPQIIKNQYNNLRPSFQTLSNIDALKNKNTLAVVTGQQLGIFGGPLYTFYKTITAIKLCNYLNSNYDRYNFVPVFWLEGDDHDFEEINNIKLPNDDNELVKFIYNDPELEEINHLSVGSLLFNPNIKTFIDEVTSFLRNTEFKNNLLDVINKSYKEGKTIKESFKDLLFNLFDEYGVILFDPQDIEIKNILKPVFRKELEEFRKHTDIVIKRSAQLEETYHAQVKVNPVNLFLNDNDGRYLLEPGEENEFQLRGKRRKYSFENIFNILETDPSKFSPNVLLRPICQDYIFPTAFYVAGPAEISYFAQIMPLYKLFNLEQPIIYPRSSATIVEKNIKKVIDKFGLKYQDIFSDKNALIDSVLRQVSSTNIEGDFRIFENEVSIIFNKIKKKLLSIDNTLEDSVEKTNKKINESISSLKEKTFEAQKKKHEVTIRQINKVSAILYPNSNLQERELNFIYFANKYGMEFGKNIFEEIKINQFEHQIIEL